MIPKGKLLIIGGHEAKGDEGIGTLIVEKRTSAISHFEILGQLIQHIPRLHHIIEIIASASEIPKEMEDMYVNAYKNEGFTHVGIIKVENSKDANNGELIKRIQSAHAVFFTGGDQEKLLTIFRDSTMLHAVKTKYNNDEHFIVSGTSAGAMVMGQLSITGGIIGSTLLKGDIQITEGFGMLNNVLIDTHFIKRGRFPRLAHAVILNPTCLGIGIEEDTALLISAGTAVTCIGSGMVLLINGKHITHTNVLTADEKTPIIADNLMVNILAQGSNFML